MKTLFGISAVLAFFLSFFLGIEIYRGDFHYQSNFFQFLFVAGILLLIFFLISRFPIKFKPVPGREYEILEWTREGGRHSMHIRYLNKANEYEDGTIKWDGDAEFLGNSNYRANKYFIKTSMVGLVFSSIDYIPVTDS